ncbi:CoA transferase [Bradyrhizobium sp. cf659]|uniref:CoA transferase n=1 Tax=Bradyrhizobium sp. cf659 TaxID=1761771 RepID=UPI0015A68AB3
MPIWARSGLADNLRPDVDSSPAAPTLGMSDQPTAVTLYAGIVTALLHRQRTGRGSPFNSYDPRSPKRSPAPATRSVATRET